MKQNTIGVCSAKIHFSHLLDRVELGEQITITRRGRPVARFVPCKKGLNAEDVQRLIANVRKEQGVYGVSLSDTAKWKTMGRR